MEQHEYSPTELRPIGYIVERIVGIRDQFIVNEVVALEERLYVLHGETQGDFSEYRDTFSAEDADNRLWFLVRGFSSAKRERKNVLFTYYEAFDDKQRYASRVMHNYHRAVARAKTLAGGPSPLYDRKDAA